jgi:hypothetical protein
MKVRRKEVNCHQEVKWMQSVFVSVKKCRGGTVHSVECWAVTLFEADWLLIPADMKKVRR